MSYQALLFCPDEKTAKLVTQVLSELDFSVEASNEPFTAVKRLMAQHFDAVVVDCDNEQNATLLFKSARNSASNQSSLAVAVVEGQAGVAKAFRIGANLVLTKPINVDQAKGTLRVARGLLRKTDTKNAPAANVAATSPTAPIAPQPRVAPSAPAARPEPAVQKPVFTPAASRPAAAMPAPAAPHFAPAAHASADEVHESAVLDLSPDLAPAAKSPVVRPAAKEYAWQPVSKPAGPMATAFQQAEEDDEASVEIEEITDAPEAEEFAEDATPEHATSPAPAALSFSAPSLAQSSAPSAHSGAASAPAPARQKVAVKAVARSKPAIAAQKTPAPVAHTETKSAHAPSKLVISAPAEEPAHVPAFASAHEAPATKKSGNNLALIAVVVVVVLGAAGYFGWTKMHSGQTVASVQQSSVEKPGTASQVAPGVTQPAQPKSSAGVSEVQTTHPETTAENSKPQTEAEKKTSKAPSANSKESDDETDARTSEEHAAKQPLIIKGGGAKAASAPIAALEAPDPLMASSGSSGKGIAAIAASGMDVAKPIQQSLRVSQGILQGRLVKKVQPVYPQAALRMRTQGTVEIAATISKTGEVTNLKQISGDQYLGRAAETAVRQWKYKPYMLDGRPVEIQTQISVEFKLPS
ncbi:MAG TPA: TonB family protein [Terriglobales bacterium]|jgi:TonB family protein